MFLFLLCKIREVVDIRSIDIQIIEDAVARLCVEANYNLDQDVIDSLKTAISSESSELGTDIIKQILENAEIAAQEKVPMCQDTGFAVIFVEIGQEVVFVNGNLSEAINNGVKKGYIEGFLRKSIVSDPLDRVNTNDNTPAIIHYNFVPGDKVIITVAPKGGGSENMSALKMLKPADGIEGVKSFIIDTVKNAGPNPCPPMVVGIGIGGTMEKAALMSKHALTRPLGAKNEDLKIAQLEEELLHSINETGIGPQGFGGKTTALAVHIEKYATHIACLPVAVNISCHAYRHKSIII